MVKEIKVFVMDKQQYDADSIAVTLDFDGITNIPSVMKVLDARLAAGKQVTFNDVFVVMLAIYAENKRRQKVTK